MTVSSPTPAAPKPAAKPSALRTTVTLALALAIIGVASYYIYQQMTFDPYDYGDLISFKDDAQSNVELEAADIASLPLFDAAGEPVDLNQYRDKQNVVLVITRGWTGGPAPGDEERYVGNVCIYCATQTARLANSYDAFRDRNAEVVVVFPVLKRSAAGRLIDFQQAVSRQGGPRGAAPFPLTLDLELQAVDRLGIRQDLSKPATYILDKQGKVRFAYVGQSLADRPSIKAMLEQLDAANRI